MKPLNSIFCIPCLAGRQVNSRNKGFTIIEFLIVLGVISILSAIEVVVLKLVELIYEV